MTRESPRIRPLLLQVNGRHMRKLIYEHLENAIHTAVLCALAELVPDDLDRSNAADRIERDVMGEVVALLTPDDEAP